jgi:hypothetical protein
MSITSTSLSTSISARVLEYTQPKYPIYRITYEYMYATLTVGHDEETYDSTLFNITTSVIVEGVPDTHPHLMDPKRKGHRLLAFWTQGPPGGPPEVNPHTFNETVTNDNIMPQSIMSELYDPAHPHGLGAGKHDLLPVIRHQCDEERVLTIYKIERLA